MTRETPMPLPVPAGPLSVAPMMDRTDRHFRFFLRQITRHTRLYTEMVTTGAIIHGDRGRHLDFSAAERPLALQLGGDEPRELAFCAALAEQWGYDEVNLNVGCPSNRVQNGRFGACLMRRPERVAECVAAMGAACSLPITVKHRIGVDEIDRYEDMANFVDVVSQAGCRWFSVHARKAWLQGLNPKQNRNIPPLRYQDIYALKQAFPHLSIEINGGIKSLDDAESHLREVDGVMMGRAIYENPYMLADADARFYGRAATPLSPHAVVRRMLPYAEQHVAAGGKLSHVTRHMLTLFSGCRGAKRWRQYLAQNAHLPTAGARVLEEALALVPEESVPSAA